MEKWVVMAKKADFQEIGKKFGIDPVIARLIYSVLSLSEAEFFSAS